MPDSTTPTVEAGIHSPRRTRHRWLAAIGITLGVLFLVVFIAAEYVAHHLDPILRRSVVANLSRRFHSRVELDSLKVSVAKGLEVDGRGLRIYSPMEPNTGTSQPGPGQKMSLAGRPMLSIDRFSFRTSLVGMLHLQANISKVEVEGMDLRILRHSGMHMPHVSGPPSRIKIAVAEILCKNVNLVIENDKPGRVPLRYVIRNLKLTHIRSGQAMAFDASLVNAKPVGFIHAVGHFGPWNSDDPRSTAVDGKYTFTDADLGTIKGIGGTLSSTGKFSGRMERITVDGVTSTPNFSLDISDHPIPLETTFHAEVDGDDGDTTLDSVQATLLHSQFTVQGTVVNIRGKGHDIAVTVHMPNGRIGDLLQLGMKAQPPIMRGAVTLDAKLRIPPGDVRVSQKIQLIGKIQIHAVQFTNAKLQDRIDSLSMRAQGKPKQAEVDGSDRTPEVASSLTASFSLNHAMMLFPALDYEVPGGSAQMDGAYSLDSRAYQFFGHIRTNASPSKMVTGWKSALLTPFDIFFKKNGAGMQLPIYIRGDGKSIDYGLAIHGVNEPVAQIASDLTTQHPGGK